MSAESQKLTEEIEETCWDIKMYLSPDAFCVTLSELTESQLQVILTRLRVVESIMLEAWEKW